MANRFVPGCCCEDGEPCATICVTVRECCLDPANGATVTATKGATTRQCTTAADGRCCVPIYPGEAGTWNLSAALAGFTTVNDSVVVTECTAATRTIDLWTPPATLTLTDPAGNTVTLTYDGTGLWIGCRMYTISTAILFDCDDVFIGMTGSVPIQYYFSCHGGLSALYPLCCDAAAPSTGAGFGAADQTCPGPWSDTAPAFDLRTGGRIFAISGIVEPTSCDPYEWSISGVGSSSEAGGTANCTSASALICRAYGLAPACSGLSFTVVE